jgi:hypothetical protein
MGCPAIVNLGDNLVFSIAVHDPETGSLTNADALPQFRIYQDELTLVLTGAMIERGKGFYYKLVSCTEANGFTLGKAYTVEIDAEVGGNRGGISYAFSVNKPTLIVKYDVTVKPGLPTVTVEAEPNVMGEDELHKLCGDILAEIEQIRDISESNKAAGEEALIAAHMARLEQ